MLLQQKCLDDSGHPQITCTGPQCKYITTHIPWNLLVSFILRLHIARLPAGEEWTRFGLFIYTYILVRNLWYLTLKNEKVSSWEPPDTELYQMLIYFTTAIFLVKNVFFAYIIIRRVLILLKSVIFALETRPNKLYKTVYK